MPKYIKVHEVKAELIHANTEKPIAVSKMYKEKAVMIRYIIELLPTTMKTGTMELDTHEGCEITLLGTGRFDAWESFEEVLKLIDEAEQEVTNAER